MFDIGFSELLLVFIIGLIVLGPQRLPVAIRTVVGWIRTLRGLAANVQNELNQELKLQELQESIKKAEQLNLNQLSPELGETVEELKVSAEKLKNNLHEKVKQSKKYVEENVHLSPDSVQNTDSSTENSRRNPEISPTKNELHSTCAYSDDLAEKAEEDEPMLDIPEDYYCDDALAKTEYSDHSTEAELSKTKTPSISKQP